MKPFDFDSPILVLAPHLIVPARNGADLLVERSSRCLSELSPNVIVVGADATLQYRGGDLHHTMPVQARMRTRSSAGLRTLATRGHYLRERFLTPRYRRRARRFLGEPNLGGVICSYLTTAEVCAGTNLPVAIWTHNDEYQWFADLASSATASHRRWAASSSLAYLRSHARDLASGSTLIHVTEADRDGFAKEIGSHANAVVPIGTDTDVLRAAETPPGGVAKLLFVGSLSVTMNGDALDHFARQYWPSLRDNLPDISMVVCGSDPSERIRGLCTSNGWKLRADVTDAELDDLYSEATFAILPFPYATGAKLKLLAAIAHGVPFLATNQVSIDADLMVEPSVRSDSPSDWVRAVYGTIDAGISGAQREMISRSAHAHSWRASTARLVDVLGA